MRGSTETTAYRDAAVLHCLSLFVPDTFIQKTKKLYLDTRTQRNLNKLNEDLNEIHNIITRNVQDVLGTGEKLDRALPRFWLGCTPPFA